jgi:sulfite reductase (NADPH) flavoprotein alpha-component
MALDSWLWASGARPLFSTVQVDDLDRRALENWALGLSPLTGRVDDFTLNQEPFRPWRLVERRHLNPGSAGWEVWHLEFEPVDRTVTWHAGDIAQILAGRSWRQFKEGDESLIEREYSIASTAEAGRIHLLVRRMSSPEGRPGLASGYLTAMSIGESVPLRIRRNPAFHGPAEDRPMILIGNGTGIAGLRAHLMRRATLGHRRSWLIFGERNAASDAFYADELQRLRAAGHLERLDLAFSRDQPQRRYVQHVLAEVAEEIRTWIDAGAAVYVCGSLRGMAPAVAERLAQILGEDALEMLTRNGRYCRDVY